MSAEKIYILGATGNIGERVVRTLLEKNIQTTVFVRDPSKAEAKFGTPSTLQVVKGDYKEEDDDIFKTSIVGHTRLFILTADIYNMVQLKTKYAKYAYEAGVKQIVDISSNYAGSPWRVSFIGNATRLSEEGILAIPNRGNYVSLRPGRFMTNMFWGDVYTMKENSCIIDCNDGNVKGEWISPNDIADLAAIVLQEDIKKHNDAVYEMVGDSVTDTQRAELLSKSLGKKIHFQEVSPKERYDMLMKIPFYDHNMAYDIILAPFRNPITPGVEVLLGRKLQTLQEWIEENKERLL